MVTRSLVVILACTSYLLVIQILMAKTIALRISPNEFLIENQRTRTRTRQNHEMQRALGAPDDEMSVNLDNLVVPDTFDPEANPEELSARIVDYANMIRNEIIFLDNSVETTTRKKGNIRKKNQVFPDPPCNCTFEREEVKLGEHYFPSEIENRTCLESACQHPYRCKAIHYPVTVLRKKLHNNDNPLVDFLNRWVSEEIKVTAACLCERDTVKVN